QDYPVVVGVQHVPRLEGDMAEGHGNVNSTGAGLRALARVGPQCLDTEIEAGQRCAVADRPMQDQARPAVGLCGPRDQVAHERCAQGAATVHDQDAARAGRLQQIAEQAVVLVAGNRAYRSGEDSPATELAELDVTDSQVRPVGIDQAGGARTGVGHVSSRVGWVPRTPAESTPTWRGPGCGGGSPSFSSSS